MKKFPIIIIFSTILILILGTLLFSKKPVNNEKSIKNKSDLISLGNKDRYEFYWGENCPHCAKEEVFLEKMEEKYSIEFEKYEIYNNLQNQQRMLNIEKEFGIDIQGVPFVLIGEKHFIGFLNEETTGKNIEEAIIETISKKENGPEKKFPENKISPEPLIENTNIETITLPIFGQIDIKNYSLPLLTILIALIDGFNPCAMWTLFFLISLLMGIEDKKRVWILGTAFIAASAFVYFLFLSAWLNLFLFLGFTTWIRLFIGILALGAGTFYLKDFATNKNAECKVKNTEQKKSVMEKMKKYVENKKLIFSFIGIVFLAFSVNLIELVCSAGLPAIYTNILSLSNLPKLNYYGYLLLYIFVFMIDDLFIFFSAMFALKAAGLHTKYSRFSHLVGGILMLIIGALLLFKPELLMFG